MTFTAVFKSAFAYCALLCICQGCASRPVDYFAGLSPDGQKLGVMKEYYPSLLHYPIPVYPKYKLGVRSDGYFHELYAMPEKELAMIFAAVVWTEDSKRVGFWIVSNSSLNTAKAYDITTLQEISFKTLEPALRKHMQSKWSEFVTPGTDPLALAYKPSESLHQAFGKERTKRFGQWLPFETAPLIPPERPQGS